MDALNSQRDEAEKVIEQLRTEAKARAEEMAMLKEEEANQQQEKQLLLDEVQQLSEAVEHLKDKDMNIAKLEQELEAVEDMKVKLEHQLKAAGDELVKLKEVNEQLQREVETTKVAIAEAPTTAEASSTLLGAVGTSFDEPVLTVGDVVPPEEVESTRVEIQESIPLEHYPVQTSASKGELEEVTSQLSDIQAELSKVKAMNEKLKAKLRVYVKREKVKSESLSESDSNELREEIEKVRQEKLNLEKTAYEVREEIDVIMRHKDTVIGDLKAKVQQLLDEQRRQENLTEKLEKLVAQRDDEIQELKNRYQTLCGERDTNILTLEKSLEQEKLTYVRELEHCKDEYERVLSKKDAEVEILQRDITNAREEIELLTGQLNEANQSLEELTKLKVDFDHIVSGLREDLQQALDEKAAADQIAHEFQVQLRRSESSTEQSGVGVRDAAIETPGAERSYEDIQLKAAQEELFKLKEALELLNKEKEELYKSLDAGKQGNDETKTNELEVDTKDGVEEMEGELSGLSNDVVWLQNELKKASVLNKSLDDKLKALSKRKRTRSDPREEDSEVRAELERTRAAKLESERKEQELREELDDFVKEKDTIVASLRSKLEVALQENEAAINEIRDYEKRLLEKDSRVRDLTEQIKPLLLDNEELNKTMEELTRLNSELRSSADFAADAKLELESKQLLLTERNQRISELETHLERTEQEHQEFIEEIKRQHEDLLSEKERQSEQLITELREKNNELEENIHMVTEQKDDIEKELLNTKSELEQVVQDSFPVIEEKDRQINELQVIMDEKQKKTDESIFQLQANEKALQERIQVLDARNNEIKDNLRQVQSELEKRLQEGEGLEEELMQAHSQIDQLNAKLSVADQEKQDINRLQSNFDHIISGLREDLQHALDGRAAADEIAHEFQVQLENLKKSSPVVSADSNLLTQENNKNAEMLEATRREVSDLRATLDITSKERDDLQDKIREFSIQETNIKEPLSSSEVNWKLSEKEGREKAVEEVILQSSVDNQVTTTSNSEIEIELENLRNEMKRIKGVNDKLKAKLRTLLKKEKAKTDSRDEETSSRDDLQAELEQVRQEKLESEKACQELRIELDSFVRQKESIVNELKNKIEQLVVDRGKSNGLIEQYENRIVAKDGDLQEMRDNIGHLQSHNDEAWRIVQQLKEENDNLYVQQQDVISQKTEIEDDCNDLKRELERVAENLTRKESVITTLENRLQDTTENYKTELEATRVQHDGVIFEIQSHADRLERELLSANKELEQLKGEVGELKREREDIAILKANFDHIVSGLHEDLQRALDEKGAADQIAHEFQVQLKRLQKELEKSETSHRDVAVEAIDTEAINVHERLENAQSEVFNLRDVLQSVNSEKLDLEDRLRRLEATLQVRETPKDEIERGEKDGDQEEIVSRVVIQTLENEPIQTAVCETEPLLTSPPSQTVASDPNDVQKVKDELSKANSELEKVKSVNERLKTKVRAMTRKNKEKESKLETGDARSSEELIAELSKVRQEKLECERAAQELRIELDTFVREKEGIVKELKARVQKLLSEKEETSSLVEYYEKQILERDAEISTLGEQFQSLEEERQEIDQKFSENRAENQNVKAVVEQVQLQKVKAEKELQQAKLQLEHLLQDQHPLLDAKDQQIADLEAKLFNQKGLNTEEKRQLKDRYDTVIAEQQNHLNNLEEALTSAYAQTEHLKTQVQELEREQEDINKLRADFSHIVSGLSEDLQRALQGKVTADEIASEFQLKLKQLDKSSVLSERDVRDAGVGTREMDLQSSEKDSGKLQEIIEHLKEEKEELDDRIMGLDEVLQDREGEHQFCDILFSIWINQAVLLKATVSMLG